MTDTNPPKQTLNQIRQETANRYAESTLEIYRKLRETPDYADIPDSELLTLAWYFVASSI